MQRRWAWTFLAPYLKQLGGDERVLDLGCGDEKNSADIAPFVPDGEVVGIDPAVAMIEWARRQYHRKEYPNLSFQLGDFFEPAVEGSFDVVLLLCSIHHAIDQVKALKNMHALLKRGGKLLVVVPSKKDSAWRAAVVAAISNPRWSSYWKNFTSRIYFNSEEYRQALEDIGFEEIVVEDVPTVDPFIDEEELI